MKKRTIISLVLGVAVVAGCGDSSVVQREQSEVAAEPHRSDEDIAVKALEQMLELATTGEWGAYVDDYYGEQQKFRSPSDRDALVKRFEDKWGEKVVEGLSRAAKLPVKIDGDKAVFMDDDETVFILHRDESGEWKFHL